MMNIDPFSLGNREVHLWWVSLPAEIQNIGSYYRTLSDEERKRTCGFFYQKDRDYFIVSRGVLRTLLGRYLKEDPEAIQLACHCSGKPCLDATPGNLPLRFNLSHSEGLAVYGFSKNREVGIDLESTGADTDIEELAETFLTSREMDDVMKQPPERRKESFLQCWAFKEAWLKATGQGIFLATGSFETPVCVNLPEGGWRTWSQEGQTSWSLRMLDAPKGYVAALAIEGKGDLAVKSYQLERSIPG